METENEKKSSPTEDPVEALSQSIETLTKASDKPDSGEDDMDDEKMERYMKSEKGKARLKQLGFESPGMNKAGDLNAAARDLERDRQDGIDESGSEPTAWYIDASVPVSKMIKAIASLHEDLENVSRRLQNLESASRSGNEALAKAGGVILAQHALIKAVADAPVPPGSVVFDPKAAPSMGEQAPLNVQATKALLLKAAQMGHRDCGEALTALESARFNLLNMDDDMRNGVNAALNKARAISGNGG